VTSATLTNGTATVNYTLPANIAVKNYTIVASYSGGSKFLSSSGTGTLTISADTTGPVVNIISPSSGQFTAGTVTVTGTVSDNQAGVASVIVQVQKSNGGGIEVSSVPATINGNTFTAQVSNLSDGPHDVKAIATDRAGNPAQAESNMIVDATGPNTTLINPTIGLTSEGEPIPGVLLAGVPNRVTARVTDSASGIAPTGVLIKLEREGAPIAQVVGTSNGDGTFSGMVSGLTAGPVNIVVIARDNVGNLRVTSSPGRVVSPGDLNGDTEINNNDLIVMVQVLLGIIPPELAAGSDLNGDGRVDIFDLIRLIQILQGASPTATR